MSRDLTTEQSTPESAHESTATAEEPIDQTLELATLAAENKQLRAEYARAQQARYRRTAVGLFIIGLIAVGGGISFPDAQTVLFALGGTGIFAGVLTAFLTPERFMTAAVGTQLFRALRRDRRAIIDELGLEGDPVYLPGEPCRLFVAHTDPGVLPDADEALSLFVASDNSAEGVAFHPTGEQLYHEFQSVATLPETPTVEAVLPAITDAVVEAFELADSMSYEHDSTSQRVVFEVTGSSMGDLTAIDHPLSSLIAVTLAHTVDAPVTVEIRDESPLLITCQYRSTAP